MTTTATRTVPDVAASTYEHLLIGKLAPHPDNPRKTVDVADLTPSVKALGIQAPLVVAPVDREAYPKTPKAATHMLLAGHRRLAAAKAARLKVVPCIVRTDITGRDAQIQHMLTENLQRTDLTPIEEADTYQLLLDITPGATQKAVAEHVGQPVKRVRERLKLAKLPEKVRGRVHNGQIQLGDAVEIAAFADDPKALGLLEGAVGTANFSWTLQRVKDTRQANRAFDKVVADLRASEVVTWLQDKPSVTEARPIREVLPAHQYVGIGGPGDAELVVERATRHHGTCTGHAVYVDEAKRKISFYCTDPDLHSSTAASPAEPPEPSKEQAAAAEAEQAFIDGLAAAAAVRRAHLAAVVAATNIGDDFAKVMMMKGLLNGMPAVGGATFWPVVREVLRVPSDTDRHEAAVAKLDALTVHQTAVYVGLDFWAETRLADAWDVRAMTRPGGRQVEGVAEWIATLTDVLQYPWSDFEREAFSLDADGHYAEPADDDRDDADEADEADQ